jgi:hypothetical protein
VSAENEKMIRRLIRQRRLLGEVWRTNAYPKPRGVSIFMPIKDAMHTILVSTPTMREIASLSWQSNLDYRVSICTVGPANSLGYPGVPPRMAQQVEVYFNGLDVETAFEEVYRTALKMWKAGAKARADHNDFKKV